ncbi:M48 family metalloprotease [Azohydromonas lata]|uniref:M48 family metalloprotease n=1 Tax=Azohydromonas lata TaxID=45677 RepID=UPI0008352090|nr:M48 family metalloprotease [Azohydromonas lata]
MKHPLAVSALVAGLALAALPATAPRAQSSLPALGDSVSGEFSVDAERRLGEQIMREIRRDPAYLDDPLLLDYVQSLWQPLVGAAKRRGEIGADTAGAFAWEVFLVLDRSVNAFALPGGHVGVHLGLIAMTVSRDELAAVLAHELSHVTQRHIARSISSSSRQSMVGLAAMILGVLASARTGNAAMAQAAVVGGQAAMVQGQLNYSRDMEREADRVGYGVHSDAGYASAGVAGMFEKLEHANRLNDSNNYPYLRSHPLTTERIGEARARVQADPHAARNMPADGAFEHALAQARARVLMDTSVQALRRAQAQQPGPGASASERLGLLYAQALASTLLREFEPADTALAAADTLLQREAPAAARGGDATQWLQLLRVQSLLARGDGRAAQQRMQALPEGGMSRALLLWRAQTDLAAARAGAPADALRRSTEALQTWVAERRDDAGAWQQLAQCADQLGLKLRAVRAEAESHAALGDIPGAVDRLRAGQQLARSGAAPADFIEASIIDARLREMEARRRELDKEMRNER